MPRRAALAAALLPGCARAAGGWPGPYSVGDGVIAHVPGLKLHPPYRWRAPPPRRYAADVVYATGADPGTLPLLVFGHGYG
eukprot:gene14086-4139_t